MSILSNDVDIFLNKLCSDLEQKSHKNKVANNYLSTPITRLFLCFCPFVSSTKKILFSALVQNQLDSVSLFLPQELINYLAHRCFTLDAKQCSLRVYIYHTCDVAQIVLGGQCTTSVSLLPLFFNNLYCALHYVFCIHIPQTFLTLIIYKQNELTNMFVLAMPQV